MLAEAAADRRVLLLSAPSAGSARPLVDLVRELAGDFPLLPQVAQQAVADTSRLSEPGRVEFWVWDLARQAEEFAQRAKAANTLRAYAADWQHFRSCAPRWGPRSPGRSPNAGLVPYRLRRHRQSLQSGIRRRIGTAEEGKKPLLTADLRRILGALPAGLQGTRDRALLLAGFAGGFRRSELAGLRRAETSEGVVALLRRSKTDPEGAGRPVAPPFGSDPATCPGARAAHLARHAGCPPRRPESGRVRRAQPARGTSLVYFPAQK